MYINIKLNVKKCEKRRTIEQKSGLKKASILKDVEVQKLKSPSPASQPHLKWFEEKNWNPVLLQTSHSLLSFLVGLESISSAISHSYVPEEEPGTGGRLGAYYCSIYASANVRNGDGNGAAKDPGELFQKFPSDAARELLLPSPGATLS